MIPNGLQILENLLRHPPVEGSISSHEAWKENVYFLLHLADLDGRPQFLHELKKKGYISLACLVEAGDYLIKTLLPLKKY